MVHTKTLAPARTIDWGAIGQRLNGDILQAITGDEQCMASENEREQCFHAYRILNRERSGETTTQMGIAHPHGSDQMGDRTCLIQGDNQVICMICPDQARLLLIPQPPCFGEIADPDSDNSDADEEQACVDECTGPLYDLNLADDEDALQTH
jgi:hypothetical protein